MIKNELPADLADVIARGMAASESQRVNAQRAYEESRPSRGRDLSGYSDDEKRALYLGAQQGRHGPEWARLANRDDVEIGVFLFFYENWSRAPSEARLARMWGDPPPAKAAPPPDRTYVARDYRDGGIADWDDMDGTGEQMMFGGDDDRGGNRGR